MRSRPLRILTVTAQAPGTAGEHRSQWRPPLAGAADGFLEAAGYPVAHHQSLELQPGYVEELLELESLERDVIVLTYAPSGRVASRVAAECERVFAKHGEGSFPGFGEALRRLALEHIGPEAILVIATAGVVNGCVAFGIPAIGEVPRIAVEALIAPVLARMPARSAGR